MRAENNKPQRPAEKNPPARKTVVADGCRLYTKGPTPQRQDGAAPTRLLPKLWGYGGQSAK